MKRRQELRNILISVGVADALGADIEFMPTPNKQDFNAQVYGPQPLRVTDDTQMSLFTAEALLRGYRKDEFQEAYLNWYRTQVARVPIYSTSYSLMRETVLYSQQAPGNTCMQSLREFYRRGKRNRNDSKGNGTVMRCFPLVPYVTVETLDDMVCDCVYSTHDHVFAFWSTKLAVLIGKGLSAGLSLKRLLSIYDGHLRMMNLQHPSEYRDIPHIGGAWVAEEALAVALYAMWYGGGDWLKTIEIATVHPGDSDTTAAIAGGFLGCMGVAPPEHLQERLDVRGVIDRLVALYPQEEQDTV